jgi:cytochrome b6-f complex iron-sulfur subunit
VGVALETLDKGPSRVRVGLGPVRRFLRVTLRVLVGVAALDAKGDAVKAADWAKANPYPGRSLVQGLKGDAHYLIVKQDGTLEDYAINAVCTHLGCVVPWNRAANKYMCPCHGSQYDPTGKVIRGPAPLSLALAHVEQPDGKVVLTPWTETDFRTDTKPWWK